MKATLHLLQPLFKDIQNLLGGTVLLQVQGLSRLTQPLLEKGGCAQTWSSVPPHVSPLTCPSPPSHLNLGTESPESELCLLQGRQGVPGRCETCQLLLR